MRAATWETAFQIILRNCSEKVRWGARIHRNFSTKSRWFGTARGYCLINKTRYLKVRRSQKTLCMGSQKSQTQLSDKYMGRGESLGSLKLFL